MKRPHPSCTYVRLEGASTTLFPALHVTDDATIISCDYSELHKIDAMQSDIVAPFDDDGVALVRVKTSYIRGWYTMSEVESIAACESVDAQMRQYAF